MAAHGVKSGSMPEADCGMGSSLLAGSSPVRRPNTQE